MIRKLKKLEQILAESPGWVTDGIENRIKHESWSQLIHPHMITYFGEEHDFSIGNKLRRKEDYDLYWLFCESWFEQPVKKKLYAYKYPCRDTGKNRVDFYDEELFCPVTERFIRSPELDIEYGDDK